MSVLDRIVDLVTRGAVYAVLTDEAQAQLATFKPEDVREACRHVLVRPHPAVLPEIGLALDFPALGGHWTVLSTSNCPRNLRVYEPGPGSSETILLATQAYAGDAGTYVSLNLNKPLAAELTAKLGKLTINWTVIEDYAQNATGHLQPGTFDAACFHHAINDILETSVSEPHGMDTTTVDWWPNERQMIEWLADEMKSCPELHAKPALLSAVGQAVDLVKPGGWLIFDHWTWERYRDVDWFPWELFQNLIPIAREWLAESGLPIREAPLTAVECGSQWWMAWQKD